MAESRNCSFEDADRFASARAEMIVRVAESLGREMQRYMYAMERAIADALRDIPDEEW